MQHRIRFVVCLGLLAGAVSPLLPQVYSINTVAGRTRQLDAPALEVAFFGPWSAAQDADGNMYVGDSSGNIIWKIPATGASQIFAGTGVAGFTGDGGPARSAQLNFPEAIHLDGKGNLYFADWGNARIRKIVLATGVISTVAGSGGFLYNGDGVGALAANMDPNDVAVDNDGNLYIADTFNDRIRKVSTSGIISTIAGNGNFGYSGDGGPATNAALADPIAVVVDPTGIVYFADSSSNRVRRVATTGIITTVAGNGTTTNVGDDGPGTSASVYYPNALALERDGNLLILTDTNVKRLLFSSNRIERVAGSATAYGDSGDGGSALSARFNTPAGINVAPNGDILVADFRNYRIRRIRGLGVATVAGLGIQTGVQATTTFLSGPAAAVADGQGGFWIADSGHRRIRQVDRAGVITTSGGSFQGQPEGIAFDGGSLYIADRRGHQVLVSQGGLTPAVFAGTANTAGFAGDGGRATSARLNTPVAVAVDTNRNVYIADRGNCRVRMIDGGGVITTLAGTGTCGSSGDGALARDARVSPNDLAVAGGKLYIAENANHRIRQIDLATRVITTVVGTGTAGYTGDGGPAAAAQLRNPSSVAVDAAGNLLIADYGNNVIRIVRGTTISTIAGNALSFLSTAESGPATGVSFDPYRISVAPDGSILVTDQFNQRIRRMTVSVPTSLTVSSGNNVSGVPGDVVRLTVKLTDANGVAIAGIPVAFAVASGPGTLSAPSATTDNNGTAFVSLTLGTPGQVRVSATVAGLTAVTFNVTINNAPPSTAPVISDGGIAGAGLSTPAVRALSTGGIASIFGQRFGAGAFAKVGTADLVGARVPTIFKGICVEVGGTRAPMFGASDTQVNFQVPQLAAGANVTVRVLTACGTATEQVSNTATIAAQAAAPEFFYFAFNADGKNPVAATDAATGAILAPATLFPGSGVVPAATGKIVTIYATGFGGTNPAVAPGEFFANIAATAGAVRVFLGGVELLPSDILYAGITPSSPGLYQLNIRIPAGIPAGNQPLVIQIGSNRSPEGPFLAITTGDAQ